MGPKTSGQRRKFSAKISTLALVGRLEKRRKRGSAFRETKKIRRKTHSRHALHAQDEGIRGQITGVGEGIFLP
jgi:hypothetical protein